MTTTTAPTISPERRQRIRNGAQRTPTAFGLMAIPDEVGDLVPAEIRDQLDRLAKARHAHHEALAEADHAHADLGPAARRDAEALADAINAGKPDPGPVNVNEAHRRLADAKRLADGHALAVTALEHDTYALVSAADLDAIAEPLEDHVADLIAQAHAALDTVADLLARADLVGTLALQLLAHPEGSNGLPVDRLDLRHGIDAVRTQADAMVRPHQPTRRGEGQAVQPTAGAAA